MFNNVSFVHKCLLLRRSENRSLNLDFYHTDDFAVLPFCCQTHNFMQKFLCVLVMRHIFEKINAGGKILL